MFLDESLEQKALRKELRAYFDELITPELKARLAADIHDPARRELMRRLGSDGWLGIGWPKEYGGQGRPPTDQFIFFDEAQRAGCPLPFVTLNTVGPTLMSYGSEEHKATYLPGILAGEVHFAIGYSEPDAGTDLASLKTRAVRDGDEWVINGQKLWTSGANDADYIWLACRTDADAPKHKGISMIIVPTSAEGFSYTKITTVGTATTTATYYSDVRVPVTNTVGEVNKGWQLITTQLNHERVGLAAVGALAYRLSDQVVAWAASTDAGDGTKMIDQPWVQMDLAQCHAKLEAMNLMNWRMCLDVEAGRLSPATSSAVKVYGTEALNDVYHRLLGIVGAEGYLPYGQPGAVFDGDLEAAGRTAQINTFGGGVNEIQREIVAWLGLQMARGAR